MNDMNRIFLGEPYYNNNIKIPLMQLKYKNGVCINFPTSVPDNFIAPDEVFTIIDDRVLNNIVPQRYMISNYGRVFDRALNKFIRPMNIATRYVDGTPAPYHNVRLAYYKSTTELSYTMRAVHRIVMLMFNYKQYSESRELSDLEVNHENGNHICNEASNLSWVSSSQNLYHAYNTGLKESSSKFVRRDLDVSDPNQPIRIVCSMIEQGYSNKEIARVTGIWHRLIGNVRAGRIYTSFSKEYTMLEESINYDKRVTVNKICEMLEQGYDNRTIADTCNVGIRMVEDIKNRITYKSITPNYTW